jgi:ribonuclease E
MARLLNFLFTEGYIINDVYFAKVENILPSIDAAFVNVGSDRMGFLHASDVMGKGALKDKLKRDKNLLFRS